MADIKGESVPIITTLVLLVNNGMQGGIGAGEALVNYLYALL